MRREQSADDWRLHDAGTPRSLGHLARWNVYVKECEAVIILGVILMLLGFLLAIPVLWVVGIVLLVVGAVLWIAGSTGRAVGGRRHYY